MEAKTLDMNRCVELRTARESLSSFLTDTAEIENDKRELESRVTVAHRSSSVDEAAVQLLRGHLYDESDLYRQIEEAERSLAIRQRAAEMQRGKIKDLEARASLKICDEVRPEYQKTVVSKMRAAASEMIRVIEIEQRFVDELERNGVDFGYLGRVCFPRVLDKESLERFLRDTAE